MQRTDVIVTQNARVELAAYVMAIIPGLGHIYLRKKTGTIYLAASVAAVAILIIIPFEKFVVDEEIVLRVHIMIVSMFAALWLWQLCDVVRIGLLSNNGYRPVILRYLCSHSIRVGKIKFENYAQWSLPIDLGSGTLVIAKVCEKCSSKAKGQKYSIRKMDLLLDVLFSRKVIVPSLLAFDLVVGGLLAYLFLESAGIIDSLLRIFSGI